MDILYTFIALIIGILSGFLLVSLFFNRKEEINTLKKESDFYKIENATLNSNYKNALESAVKLESELKNLRQENAVLAEKTGALQMQRGILEEKLQNQEKELIDLEKRFQKEFENVANRILEEKSLKFTSQNEKQIGDILNPLKENIELFKNKIEENNKESIKQNSSLQEQLKMLRELNQQITKEAENLTKALKGDNKVQGNWGEVILETILERSGLVKDREYFTQQSINTNDGRRFRPDVIIKLPEDKIVVIDSKVSLLAYERFCSCEEISDQDGFLKEHVSSLKNHIRSLSEKRYQDLPGLGALDFILLFIPIEPAFLIAMQRDQKLFNEAFDRNILIVSPSTLIASLKIISSTWKYEYQNQNAREIARQGGELYDKFVGFTNDLLNLGANLDRAQGVYSDALKKLSEGKGNLVTRAGNLKNLGLKTSKSIHISLEKNKQLNNSGQSDKEEEK